MKLGTKEIVAFGVPYLVAVGACYLFGYWGAFQINVLEYISFADVAKIAVYPLVASVIFALAGVAISELVWGPYFPPGGGNSTAIGRFGLKRWRWLVTAMLGLVVVIAIFGPEPRKWFLVASLVSLLSISLTYIEQVIEIFPNPRASKIAMYLFLLLPTTSFAHGREQAYLVKTGNADHFVDIQRSKLPLTVDEKNQVAYLGLLGNLYVLREGTTGHIVFVKQRDDSPLFLVPRK